MFARLALASIPYSVDRPYDYRIPEDLEADAAPGLRVFAPFSRGNRVTEGVILALSETSEYPDGKEILRFADSEPLFTQQQLQLAYFMRERYFCTVYEALRAMVPSGYWFDRTGRQKTGTRNVEMAHLMIPAEEGLALAESRKRSSPKQAEILELLASFEALPVKDLLHFAAASRQSLQRLREQDLIGLYSKEVYRRPEPDSAGPSPLPVLTAGQQQVLNGLRDAVNSEKPALLFGVTGSGKTSVYAQMIAETLEQGKGAILLLPEISLTPQFMSAFSAWFGSRVALLHSGLTPGERCDEWRRIRRGEAQLAIGTRSAVFAPVQNLGLMIIDEEQEDSYRSETSPRYQAREVARFRCAKEGAFLLLGSATPDLRSRYLADTGVYSYFRLTERFNQKPLPPVRIVDMKEELLNGNTSNFSMPLREAILQRIERGEQSILFLNRRGTSKLVSCSLCGHIYRCPHCSVSMTWHAGPRRLICHYCGYTRTLDRACPECGGALNFIGAGTQKIEEELKELFPGTDVLRVDADSVVPAGSHRALFRRFTEEKIPIMIGTQMIAKGLNFENVTLVGILSADQSLYAGDFRAGERSFSLFTQVIGRCGRGALPGEAIIQTFTPQNETLFYAAHQDYDAFYDAEIKMRRIQNAPPFSDWVSLSAIGPDERKLVEALRGCRSQLLTAFREEPEVQVLGPVPMAVAKVSDQYRYRLQILCRLNRQIRSILSSILISCGTAKELRGIRFYVEIDPSP